MTVFRDPFLFPEADGIPSDLRKRLSIYAAFPNCAASREQAFAVYKMEKARFFKEHDFERPAVEFQLCQTAQTIKVAVDGKNGLNAALGMVSAALCIPKENGKSRSLHGAAFIAQKIIEAAPDAASRIVWRDTASGDIRGVKGQSSELSKAFRHSRVTHILAGFSIGAYSIKERYIFDDMPLETDAYLLRTIAEYEQKIWDIRGSHSGQLTLLPIAAHLPQHIMDLEPLRAPDELREFLWSKRNIFVGGFDFTQ